MAYNVDTKPPCAWYLYLYRIETGTFLFNLSIYILFSGIVSYNYRCSQWRESTLYNVKANRHHSCLNGRLGHTLQGTIAREEGELRTFV